MYDSNFYGSDVTIITKLPSYLGASHSDDLLFLFNMNLPVVVCDLKSFLVGLSLAWTQCIYEVGLANSTKCLTDPQGSVTSVVKF